MRVLLIAALIAITGHSGAPGGAQRGVYNTNPTQAQITQNITAAAQAYDLPPGLMVGLAWGESDGMHYHDTGAVVRGDSDEIGVFQIMPSTGRPGVDLFNLYQNINEACYLMRQLIDRYNREDHPDSVAAALGAYNLGPDGRKRNPKTARRYVRYIRGKML